MHNALCAFASWYANCASIVSALRSVCGRCGAAVRHSVVFPPACGGGVPISGQGHGRRQVAAGRMHGASPISGRKRGRRQVAAGRAHGQGRGLPCALPPLRSALRPSAGRGAAVDKLPRGVRTGRGGDYLVHSAFAHSDSAVGRQGQGGRRGKCGALREEASAFALARPHPALGGAGHGVTTARPLPHSGADTPGSGRRANDILYIRVRRREGENVLHKVGRNDVDNFSVDNPLWITAAAGGRSLRGRRRRVCGGSVNDGAAGANVIQRKAKGYAEEM